MQDLKQLMMMLAQSNKGMSPEKIRTLFKALTGNRKPKVKGPIQPPQPGSSIYAKNADSRKEY
jgi:hypothetical protein